MERLRKDHSPEHLHVVLVFVNHSVEEILWTIREADLYGPGLCLQLHGDEPPEALAGLARRALKAVRVGKGFTDSEALRYDKAAGLLVDTRLPGETMMPGGTGVPFDWTLVRGVRERASFLMLAGGLSPDNVAEALEAVRPDAVDVSSGVESLPGRKDPEKVHAFVRRVREWERAQ